MVPTHLTIDAAARACSVSRDTIKRRLRNNQFPGAVRGEPAGNRPPPWLIPVEDLAAAGLRPAVADAGSLETTDPEDQSALRAALAHHEAVAGAREHHLTDLRAEVRRLHDRLTEMSSLLAHAIGTRDTP